MSLLLSIASVEDNGDEWDNTCGVCLDEGDFVFVHPCNHRLCSESTISYLPSLSSSSATSVICALHQQMQLEFNSKLLA
jgi:hypothetical protein